MTPAVPIAIYYFTLLGALGIFWPFFSLYLAQLGLSPSEITGVMMLSPLMALVAPPLTGLIADARRARVWLLRAATAATLLAFSGFFLAGRARAAIFVTTAVFGLCRAPLLSLADSAAIDCARRHGGSYGAIRTWGSVGFLVTVLAGGAALEARGVDQVLGATASALALAALSAWLMPAPPVENRPRAVGAWLALVRARDGWLLLAAVALAQAAGAGYDACFSLRLSRLGFGARFIGLAWGIGVAAEAALLAVSGRVLARVGAGRALAWSMAIAAARWLLLAHVASPWVILASQPLHGVTFGLFYVAAVTLMRDRAGADVPTAGQGMLAAALGAGSVLGMLVAGRLLERGGARALYTVDAAVAALAAACAFGYARTLQREPLAARLRRAA